MRILSLLLASSLGASVPVAMQNMGGTCQPGPRWCLGAVSVVKQLTGSEGGPQALEGYTLVDTRGSVRLAHGTIGNIEQAGDGDLIEARPLQSGGVVTGQGRVSRWIGLFIDKPKEARAGQVADYRAIQFSNGLFLTPDMQDGKPILKLCPDDPRQAPCVIFKP